jgi:hypothetical protein
MRWRNFYNCALHAFGNTEIPAIRSARPVLRFVRAIERLWQIDLEETTEQEEIYAALADLSIFKNLYRKYGRIG